MRADDVLTQIDTALHDYDIGPDAMRSAPDLSPPPRPLVRMPFGGGPREILIQRLIERHGLTRMTARHAVMAAERGGDSERAELVRAEAQAIAAEMRLRIRIALQPMAEAAIRALRQLGESLKQLQEARVCDSHGRPLPPRDRPPWQSPYGPPRRRW